MESILANAREVFDRHSGWIVWNLFLAFIPLILSFWLFRRRRISHTLPWWLLFIVFIAFLPNAPYLLTDIIHLLRAIRAGYSAWIITLIFIPLHTFAILAGLEAYVISLLNQGHYLKRVGAKQFVLGAELLAHVLCAIGIYLGRFKRFNSWDLITQPGAVLLDTLNQLTSKRPLAVTIMIFVIITVTYWLTKQVTIGVILRIRQLRQGEEEPL
ncbi:DUF1361 domain-containing protein [Trichothermofontia sichuanensis B231]|uniref:DUF1361 domain-containing protein n=1 Tax=Trichothermofontia sichuanensis TaxID=3045816 RepID=UPI002246D384|nr:DUF1361 domain-containing protein [Trichothermofontia sichuanensis]UZQ53579.1 DUF1361 domain-containing protein [Trichothermofontia sichuanensis B231]